MSSGIDAIVGNALPVVNPDGGTCSARLGNAQAGGGGESLMYKWVVDATNNSFTYSYSVLVDGGNQGHDEYQQPFFRIRMYLYDGAGDSTTISCGEFDVNGLTAAGIGGFVDIGNEIIWKDWRYVSMTLNN